MNRQRKTLGPISSSSKFSLLSNVLVFELLSLAHNERQKCGRNGETSGERLAKIFKHTIYINSTVISRIDHLYSSLFVSIRAYIARLSGPALALFGMQHTFQKVRLTLILRSKYDLVSR